eukprot:CAMPEP_0180822008 /NCGR_PEP_ID=MMETSP1038_2-20121128/71138_1 /TAXON_ID=632150 /ORGANISM="Azadinium spinosum, Strain 3D9" /LENGTH=42 /DNA_ID= /DNA_START= /DNA_END= /DNA_ORIENTATION=
MPQEELEASEDIVIAWCALTILRRLQVEEWRQDLVEALLVAS